ncbi:MAG: hypothetical protein M3Q58_03640 [Bacteroidota bacterium]|nr:hypothetical protein [Bacteroidota bacterium]
MIKEESKKQESTNDYQDTFTAIVKHPVTKVILIGVSVVGIIFISGLVMKVVANSVVSYKEMKEAIRK